MQIFYPITINPDEEGRLVVEFPDLPGAVTDGADMEEALAEAEDCLDVFLVQLIRDRKDVPSPSDGYEHYVPVKKELIPKLIQHQKG